MLTLFRYISKTFVNLRKEGQYIYLTSLPSNPSNSHINLSAFNKLSLKSTLNYCPY